MPTCQGGSDLSHLGAAQHDGYVCTRRNVTPQSSHAPCPCPKAHTGQCSLGWMATPSPFLSRLPLSCHLCFPPPHIRMRQADLGLCPTPLLTTPQFPTLGRPRLAPCNDRPRTPCWSPNTPVYFWPLPRMQLLCGGVGSTSHLPQAAQLCRGPSTGLAGVIWGGGPSRPKNHQTPVSLSVGTEVCGRGRSSKV